MHIINNNIEVKTFPATNKKINKSNLPSKQQIIYSILLTKTL